MDTSFTDKQILLALRMVYSTNATIAFHLWYKRILARLEILGKRFSLFDAARYHVYDTIAIVENGFAVYSSLPSSTLLLWNKRLNSPFLSFTAGYFCRN